MMKAIISIMLFIATVQLYLSQNYKTEIDSYVKFLETQDVSAKDYLLGLFKKYDIVVLCERHHGELTQYDLIYDIVSSPDFQKNIGNVFTEVGSINNRNATQRFLHKNFHTEEKKASEQLNIYRNMGFYGIWEKTNFYNFIGQLNSLNSKLSEENKVNLFTSDIRRPIKKERKTINTINSYFKNVEDNRDSIMATNIIHTFDSLQVFSKRKKALVIMNYRHAFSKSLSSYKRNCADYLHEKYGDRFANVLINGTALLPVVDKSSLNKPTVYQQMLEALIQDGKWDASFKVTGKENIGFNFMNTPFGKDNFDKWYRKNDFKYSDVFTGYIFYLPIEKHIDSFGVENLTKGHEKRIYRTEKEKMRALGSEPMSLKEIQEFSTMKREMSYDNLDSLILSRNKWLSK